MFTRREVLKVVPYGRAIAAAGSGYPILDGSPQLFVDYDRVESIENVIRTFHAAEKHRANPVLRRIHPWEQSRGTWGSVIFDAEERIFKAWLDIVVSRVRLRAGRTYENAVKEFEPYDRTQDPNEAGREALRGLIDRSRGVANRRLST